MRREAGVGCESPDLPTSEAALDKEKAQHRVEEEEERRHKADIANTIALESIKVTFDQVRFSDDETWDLNQFFFLWKYLFQFSSEKILHEIMLLS